MVRIKGNRVYLAGTTVENAEFDTPKAKQIEVKTKSYYFEPTTDGRGVKLTYVLSVTGTKNIEGAF